MDVNKLSSLRQNHIFKWLLLLSVLPVRWVFSGSTANNKKSTLSVLRACPVALEDATGVSACPMKSLLPLFNRG